MVHSNRNPCEPINGIGRLPTQLFTIPTHPVPLLVLRLLLRLCRFLNFDTWLQKSSTRLFSFLPFQDKGHVALTANSPLQK